MMPHVDAQSGCGLETQSEIVEHVVPSACMMPRRRWALRFATGRMANARRCSVREFDPGPAAARKQDERDDAATAEIMCRVIRSKGAATTLANS